MLDQVIDSFEEHLTFIPLITTHSLSSSHSKEMESSSELIKSDFLSPFTAAKTKTPDTTPTIATSDNTEVHQQPLSNSHKDDLVIPVIERERYIKGDEIIKQGLVLCTRTAEWYTRKKSTTRELQLRKTRLRWRQFKAVLRPDKIELYHVTTTFLNTQRIAHVIYLNNKYPYRRVCLSLVSTQDYIWCLEFTHHETKSNVSFHFQSMSLSDAQDWYMALYHTLPALPACKRPIPTFVDIRVIIDTPMQIRLPLDFLLTNTKDTLLNIYTQDIKPAIRSLLQKDDLLHVASWLYNDFRLCWRPNNVSAKPSNTVFISGDPIEWLAEKRELIGPQLIEQRHVLELHASKEPLEKLKQEKKVITFDSLLISKTWTKSKCKRAYFYVVLYGNLLFFFDKPYYYYYKRQEQRQQSQRQRQEQSQQKKEHHNWFSATSGLLLQQRKLMISKENKRRIYELGNQSSPHFKYSSPESIPLPDPTKLVNAHLVLDLHKVTRVQPMIQATSAQHDATIANTFEIHIHNSNVLYYEALSTQIMLQWVTLINNTIKTEHLLLNSSLSYRHHQSCNGNRNILHSGFLYVKRDFKRSFQPQYCVLSKSEGYDGLIIFDTLHKTSKRQSVLLGCTSRANSDSDEQQQQERKEMVLYEKKRILLHLKNAYVYSGDECILDKYEHEKVEPLRLYKDGVVTGGNKTSECIFVIWQLAKKRFVPNVREYLSLFKLGHRLGNRGTCWVFKARNKQERDEWLESLTIELELLSRK